MLKQNAAGNSFGEIFQVLWKEHFRPQCIITASFRRPQGYSRLAETTLLTTFEFLNYMNILCAKYH